MLAQRGQYRKMMDSRKKPLPENNDDINHADRMHFWFQKENLPYIEDFISGPIKNVDQFPLYDYKKTSSEDLRQLLQWFKEKEYEVFSRNLLSPELELLTEGLCSVMVKVPKMQPLYLEESLRSIGGERLREIPKMLGLEIDESTTDPFTRVPHPFP